MTPQGAVPADASVAEPSAAGRAARPTFLLAIGAAIVGFLVRFVPILTGGGLHSYGRYDDGVYYTAATSLTFGRVPYRDFVMLHPPGLMLVLVPFAWLGRLTTDANGLAVGRLVFIAIGALNCALVAVLAKRWGWAAGIAGGLLYACWMPSVYGEQSTLLEPVGTTATLCALLLLCRPGQAMVGRRAEVLAGVALGLGVTFKLWYVTPVLVVVVWHLLQRRFAATLRVLGAAAASAAIVLLPLFVLAPGQMWRMIVLDQLNRPRRRSSLLARLPYLFGVRPLANGHTVEVYVFTAIATVVVVAAAFVCLRDPAARLIVGVLGLNLAVILLAPSFFLHYAELTAAPLAIVIAIGVGRLYRAVAQPRLAGALVAGFCLASLASGIAIMNTPESLPFPRSFAAAAPPGCVMADDPTALIEMDRLTTDLKAGCVVPVDVTGITYDRLQTTGPNGVHIDRRDNLVWQQYLHDYLFSGTSFVVLRPAADGIPQLYRAMIKKAPVLARANGLVLHSGLDTGPLSVDAIEADSDRR